MTLRPAQGGQRFAPGRATTPNECENRRRRPSRGLAHTPGTPIFALFRWTSERAASIRCPDGGSGQGSFASFLKGPLPPSGHRIERGTIDLQSDINCLPERSLLGAFGKQHDDYDHDVFNSAGSTLATPHFGPENGVHLIPHFFTEQAAIKLSFAVLLATASKWRGVRMDVFTIRRIEELRNEFLPKSTSEEPAA